MSFIIRDSTEDDISLLTDLIRESFKDVAERFNLTAYNAPSHPSNCTEEWIIKAIQKGNKYYILEYQGVPCGCVALEEANSEVCYLERLSVLPNYRIKGFGKALVNHIIHKAKKITAKRIEIGIIAENLELKNWYIKQGFIERDIIKYEHLPFKVLFLVKVL